MITVLEYALGMILVGGVLFLLVSFVFGRGEALAPMPPDSVPVELPEDRPAGSEDIHRLRLPVVLRGYRMHEVDWVLDRLATELELRDAEIARLRAELTGEPATPGGDVEPADGRDPAERDRAGARDPEAEREAEREADLEAEREADLGERPSWARPGGPE